MLCYMHGLAEMMQPNDFTNSSDVRLAVSRIVTWTTEPKSVEVRKVFYVKICHPRACSILIVTKVVVSSSGNNF